MRQKVEGVDIFVQRLQGLLFPLNSAQTQPTFSLKSLVFCSSHVCFLFLCHELSKHAWFVGAMISLLKMALFVTFALLEFVYLPVY